MGMVSWPLITGRCVETVNSPAPMTIVYVGIGWDSVHIPEVEVLPFATTRHDGGAVMLNMTRALSDGWSSVGIQNRARSGQLSANATRRRRALGPMINPSCGLP